MYCKVEGNDAVATFIVVDSVLCRVVRSRIGYAVHPAKAIAGLKVVGGIGTIVDDKVEGVNTYTIVGRKIGISLCTRGVVGCIRPVPKIGVACSCIEGLVLGVADG